MSGTSSLVIAVIYRPGSEAVTLAFYAELADVLDRLATFALADPVQLVDDVNVHLERPADHTTREFTDVLAAHGLVSCVSDGTHDDGGTLDVVAARDDSPLPCVDVLDVGLSDHRLLRWTASLSRPTPVYVRSTGRSWSRLDKHSVLTTSRRSTIRRLPPSLIGSFRPGLCSVVHAHRTLGSTTTVVCRGAASVSWIGSPVDPTRWTLLHRLRLRLR